MTKDNHVIDLIPAYALDCLDKDEASLVANHLEVCSDCRDELRAYQEVADQFTYTISQIDPPARVKSELMARVQASSRARESASIVDKLIERLLFLSTGRLARAWAVISFVLILVLVASNLILWNQVNQLRSDTQRTTMQVVTLNGTDKVPAAMGMVVISRDGHHGTLVVDELPPLDETREYQLWLIRDGQRISGAVFSVSEDGYANKWINAPEPLNTYSSFGITIEPAGGSPGPTGEKVLGGDF